MGEVAHDLTPLRAETLINRLLLEAEALGQQPPSYRTVVAGLGLAAGRTAPAHFRRIFFDIRAGRHTSELPRTGIS